MYIVNRQNCIASGSVLARPSQNKRFWFTNAVLLLVVEWRQNLASLAHAVRQRK